MTTSSRLKQALYPIRTFLGRFAVSERETLYFKIGSFIAQDKIEGDYLHFGASSGTTLADAFWSIESAFKSYYRNESYGERQRIWEEMRFIAFDSFQGLPSLTGIDGLSRDLSEGRFARPEARFQELVAERGVPRNRLVTVPGWFKDTLTDDTRAKYRINRAAIVNVDCDLYESAELVLKFITPILTDGTVIIFDDWYNFHGSPDLGEQRAFREWLDDNPDWSATEYQKDGVWRNSFVVNRKLN